MANEPPIVPLFLTAASPIFSARVTNPENIFELAATSACVVPPPIEMLPSSFKQIPFISSIAVKLTRVDGLARRCFIVGIKVCPPPSSCASSFTRALNASDTVLGCLNSKLYIFLQI